METANIKELEDHRGGRGLFATGPVVTGLCIIKDARPGVTTGCFAEARTVDEANALAAYYEIEVRA